MEIEKKLFWDINEVLKRDRLLNFVVGGRSIGKTYGTKKWAMKHFEETGERFLFMRRTKTQLSDIGNFLVKFNGEDAELRKKWSVTKDGQFLYEGKTGGYWTSLTQLADKGKDFDNVTTVIYDEFIIANDGYKRYLKDEVDQFLAAIDTIGRYQKDVRCFLLANNVSTYNPYFVELEYQYDGKHNIWCPKEDEGLRSESLVMQCDSTKLRDVYSSTRFGKMIKGTQYGNHALYNEELTGQTDFVRGKSREAKCICGLRVDGREYGIWRDIVRAQYFVCHQIDHKDITWYAGTDNDQTIGCYGYGAYRKSMVYNQIVTALNYGGLFYEDTVCRGAIYKTMKGGF